MRYVLEGSVRKSGNRIRVTAQLIYAQDGAHLWAERYDRIKLCISDGATGAAMWRSRWPPCFNVTVKLGLARSDVADRRRFAPSKRGSSASRSGVVQRDTRASVEPGL